MEPSPEKPKHLLLFYTFLYFLGRGGSMTHEPPHVMQSAGTLCMPLVGHVLYRYFPENWELWRDIYRVSQNYVNTNGLFFSRRYTYAMGDRL